MPVTQGFDHNGIFYRWGTQGKKYYYTNTNTSTQLKAYEKALRQGRAIAITRQR